MDLPYCEVCGEQHATMKTQECALCDDCAAAELRAALKPLMGAACANISRRDNGFLTVCLAPYGLEHDHD